MEIRANESKEKQSKSLEPKITLKKDPQIQEASPKKPETAETLNQTLNSHESGSITPEEVNWGDFENCLKDIDMHYDRPDYISQIRTSVPHIESLKELVRVYAEVNNIKEDYEIQNRQDEIVYLFKSGKNEYDFFKLFDNLLEACGSCFTNKNHKNILTQSKETDAETRTIREIKEEVKLKSDEEKTRSEILKTNEKIIHDLISSKLNSALKRLDEKMTLFDMKSLEMDKQVNNINKSLRKIQSTIDKKWNELKKVESHFDVKSLKALPLKRRRFSTVDSVINFKVKPSLKSPSDFSDSRSDESFGSTCQDQSVILEKDNDLDDMIFKLRLRGGVKMTDIWRLNNFAVIFSISDLKGILDVGKIDELSKLKPWASRWKAKDKYFSNMKKVASPSYSRNITKYENSLAGITACLTEYYLFHFDLYCTWRKLKLWLKDINKPIDLCITPSYPHRIRSVIAEESETGFALLLEKSIPHLTKQRLERTPNLILYSFIDDYPDDYLIKSQYCIVGRHQQTELRKILNIGHV
jgi:hypothetical protein